MASINVNATDLDISIQKEKHRQVQTQILNAKFNAIKHLIDMLDAETTAMEEQFHALPNATESQTIAYYSAKTQLFKFKGALQEQQHKAYVEYQAELKQGDWK